MPRQKISTTIYVTIEQSERLKLLSERTKVPVAVYIREGIDLVLQQYGHLLPGQLALGSPSEASVSSVVDGASEASRRGPHQIDGLPGPSSAKK
jgi:hypothetical protein